MTQGALPTSIEELQRPGLSLHREVNHAKREVVVAKQQAIELTSTVSAQKKRLEQSERTIKELLQALQGKKRERLDPDQLLLFELGELERLIEDAARGHHTLAIIARLYEVERATRNKDAIARRLQRDEHSRPLLNDLKSWLDAEVFLPKSLSGKAATYTLKQWAALNRFLEHGDLSIDNNAAERAMKPVAIGRKNWMFVGSVQAGGRAAVLTSPVASCKETVVQPWAWLKDVLIQLPLGASLESLLPNSWLESHPQHRWNIADRRKLEREKRDNQ
jgi:hypothetical protein